MLFTQNQIIALEKYLGVQKQQTDAGKKYCKKIQKYSAIFRYIPGLLLLGIGNSLAMNAGKTSSDIDVFIITRRNALWFVRIVMTLLAQLFGIRKTQTHHAGKICLSFFCTEDALDFSPFALKYDIYLYYWILTMKPIIVKGDIYERFVAANSWVDFEGFSNISKNSSLYVKYTLQERGSGNIFLTQIDMVLKKIFLPRTLKHFLKLGKPFGVIVTDTMLKFHDADQRKVIRENVLEKK